MLQREAMLLEKRLEEMRTVMKVDREEVDIAKDNKFIWQGGRVSQKKNKLIHTQTLSRSLSTAPTHAPHQAYPLPRCAP